MAGILTKDTKLYVGTATYDSSTDTWTFSDYSEIYNVLSLPSFSGDVERVDTTCLSDGHRKYINGIRDFGTLSYKLLFDNSDSTSNFRVLRGYEEAGTVKAIKIELPDALTTGSGTHHGTTFEYAGEISVGLDEGEVNAAYTFTLTTSLQSDIDVTNPA